MFAWYQPALDEQRVDLTLSMSGVFYPPRCVPGLDKGAMRMGPDMLLIGSEMEACFQELDKMSAFLSLVTNRLPYLIADTIH
jgi:hypothetical protein